MTQGRVLTDGLEVRGIQKSIGYMFARRTDAVAGAAERYFGLVSNAYPTTTDCRASWLHQVGLAGFEGSYRHELSQGMRQRRRVARTFATDPEILLMDEPFGALDAQTRIALQDAFLRIWEEKKKTVLFITHDLMEAILLSDVVLIMSHRPGRIKRSSTSTLRVPGPRPTLTSTDDFKVSTSFFE